MKSLFHNIPESVVNIQEIVDKIETFQLARDVLLPKFDIPTEFVSVKDNEDGGKRGENAYLKHITYEGANDRYSEINDEIKDKFRFFDNVLANRMVNIKTFKNVDDAKDWLLSKE